MMSLRIARYLSRMTSLAFACAITFTTNVNAQKQNNQWRFGIMAAIDFNTQPPVALGGCAIQTGEGSASIADKATGALLFYTDGVTVWDASNQPMPNGTGLLGGTSSLLSSTTAAVIIPKPSTDGIFYLVTIDEQSSNNGVRYSVVDMSLNNGRGDVVAAQKNQFLYSTTSEKLQVVPKADGCGYWLITNDTPGNRFAAFEITRDGIQTTPIFSTLGGTQGNGAGHMKINRQFNQLALGNFFDGTIELFDFDNATGVVSNPTIWDFTFPNSQVFYGLEFSPDGSKLYVSNLEIIVQYDITQPTAALIEASGYNVTQSPGSFVQPATLQLGPDNKIYVAKGVIDVINAPNNAGALCDYQQNIIDFQNAGGGSGYGLPQWVYYNEAVATNNEILYQDTCLANAIPFSLQDTTGFVSIAWEFDDPGSGSGNISALKTPSHTFSDSGTYNIRAILNFECNVDTFFKSIKVANCETDCAIKLPNAFTPNNDGANDSFHPFSKCPITRYELSIYSRWGELVFKTDRPDNPWDGKNGGTDCLSDVYVYRVIYQIGSSTPESHNGEVTLLR